MASATLRVILGDQLNMDISSLSDLDKHNDTIVMCEVWEEATYVKHHKKKIAFIFSAMRHFAEDLTAEGYHVHYTTLDDPDNRGSFRGEVVRAVERYKPDSIIVTEPGEYRVLSDIKTWHFGIPVEVRPDNRFLCKHREFAN